MGSRTSRGTLPEPLDRLGQFLTEVRRLAQKAGGAEQDRLLGVVRSTLEALHTAAGVLTARSAGGGPGAPDVLSTWGHELRGPMAAMAGWAYILGLTPDETKRLQAAEAIERNAKLLMELLAHPPA